MHYGRVFDALPTMCAFLTRVQWLGNGVGLLKAPVAIMLLLL